MRLNTDFSPANATALSPATHQRPRMPESLLSAPRPNGKSGVTRCRQCEGSFGLIRHRYALRQFCSKECLHEYQLERERAVVPIKQETDFLGRER
jgi:hypothetical protein